MAEAARALGRHGPRRGLVAPAGPSADALRTLRLSVSAAAPAGSDRRCILFTSADPGAGKSTVAANYALVASLSHQRVLLIDADLRQPALHEFFRVRRSPGLVDALGSEHGLRELVVRTTVSFGALDLLPAGEFVWRPGDLVSSPRMGEILAEARTSYDLVVIDSPPLLSAPDAGGLAAHGDIDVLLVVRVTTKRRAVREAARSLELIDVPLRGIVVNRHGRLSSYGY